MELYAFFIVGIWMHYLFSWKSGVAEPLFSQLSCAAAASFFRNSVSGVHWIVNASFISYCQ